MPSSAVRVLSIHADYQCAHAGACCTARWPIPIEADRLTAARGALASGRLRPAATDGTAPFDSPAEAPADTPALLATSGGACVFYDAGAPRHCRIQSALGHDALPLACRQFPRVSIHDPRGTSVTLSHYCPTAAALLTRGGSTSILVDPPAFRGGEYVGLDARASLPPLLRPEMLMDWDSWWTWERQAVKLITNVDDPNVPATAMLARIGAAVEFVRSWRPGGEPLLAAVERAFIAAAPSGSRVVLNRDARLREVLDAIPLEWQPAALTRDVPTSDAVARQFLAAHAFANWTAHLGGGLRSWLRSLEAAAALLDAGLGVRQADLLLRHLGEPERLAQTWSAAEG